jgi:N-acetylmuramoyl-L-alanine amidase
VKRVFIDRGHGLHNSNWGKTDSGAAANGETEWGMVSAIAEAVRKELPMVEIILTPEHSIPGVVAFVGDNAEYGDVLLVLHMNAAGALATGLEVIYSADAPAQRATEAFEIARLLSAEMGQRNRGAKLDSYTPKGKARGLPILNESRTKCPSYLLELGFITNKGDIERTKKFAVPAIKKLITKLGEIIK